MAITKEEALRRCGIFAAQRDLVMSNFYKKLYFALRDGLEEKRNQFFENLEKVMSERNRLTTPAVPRMWLDEEDNVSEKNMTDWVRYKYVKA